MEETTNQKTFKKYVFFYCAILGIIIAIIIWRFTSVRYNIKRDWGELGEIAEDHFDIEE